MSSLGKIFGKENSLKKASKTEIKGKRRRNIERERVGERVDRERERYNENRVLSNAKRAKKRETFKLRTGPHCAFQCWLI